MKEDKVTVILSLDRSQDALKSCFSAVGSSDLDGGRVVSRLYTGSGFGEDYCH